MAHENLQITVFVNNIPASMHWKGLWVLFNFHRDVKDAFIPKKKSKFGSRFGFMRFSSVTDAQQAIERLNGFIILGYRIRVKMASFKGRRKIWGKRNTHVISISNKETYGNGKENSVSEKGETSGNSKDDRLKSRNCFGMEGNQVRVVQGFVE
ncbi:hypothetical protein J1N35_001857 [Gossypium stocksii]|uniref:RRM domain-containing protein n=1 Tax=Gossypium stocksii TaxID=47602 RepID=A0A9D3WJY2_9ROSI|nr:hypothetical protein J1N35_001857 [Gossypium stocksii]